MSVFFSLDICFSWNKRGHAAFLCFHVKPLISFWNAMQMKERGRGGRFKLAMLTAHLDSHAVNRESPQNTVYMSRQKFNVFDVNGY